MQTRTDRFRSLILGLLLLCGSKDSQGAPSSPSSRPPPPPPVQKRQISSAESQAHGLPPAAFSLEHDGSMIWKPFPEPGMYATLSGPPGGALGLAIFSYQGGKADDETLLRLIKQRIAAWHVEPLLGKKERLVLGGAARPALGYIAGTGHARTRYCAVLLPPSPQGQGLWILFGQGPAIKDDKDCAGTLAHPVLQRVLRSFRLIPGG